MRGVGGEIIGDDDGKTIGDRIARSSQDQSMVLRDLILWVDSMNTFYWGSPECWTWRCQREAPAQTHPVTDKIWLRKYKWLAQGHTRCQRQRTQSRTQKGQSSLPSTASHIIPGMLKELRFTNPTLSGFLGIRKGKKISSPSRFQSQ